MVVFYTQNEDGTLNSISKSRIISEQYIDVAPRDFEAARCLPHDCKIVNGALVVSEQARELAAEYLKHKYERKVDELIRAEWSVNREFALINARDEEPEKYAAYRAKVKELKAQAKAEIYGNE